MYCDKRNQKHRKGKEASPSLFKPIPFDKGSPYRLCVRWIVTARLAEPATALETCSPEQTFSLHKTNAIAKPGIRLCPSRIAVRSAKRTFGYFSCAEEKYHPSPCSQSRNEPVSLPRGRKDYSSSKGKREGRSFCHSTKGTKNTEKEKEQIYAA